MAIDPRRLEAYFKDGRPVHLALDPSDVAPFSLLPGDPARVWRIAAHLGGVKPLLQNREFTAVTGEFEGVPVTVCSTGIGGPSTEIAVLELAALGVHTFVRVGGTGALQEGLVPGMLLINSAMMRMGGTSLAYAPPPYPAVAHPEVLMSLVQAAAEEGAPFAVGIGGTTASYYQGQGRDLAGPPGARLVSRRGPQPGLGTHPGDPAGSLSTSGGGIEAFQHLGLLNLEMEAETLLTLASLMKLRAGTILAVHVNRTSGQWDADYEASQERLIRVALRAVKLLHRVDRTKPPGSPPEAVASPARFADPEEPRQGGEREDDRGS